MVFLGGNFFARFTVSQTIFRLNCQACQGHSNFSVQVRFPGRPTTMDADIVEGVNYPSADVSSAIIPE